MSGDQKRYRNNLRYNRGDNPTIKDRDFYGVPDPHGNIAVPYGRKIIKTVAGYMYKPGLIQVVSEDEQYLEAIKDVYWDNNEDTKTAQVGEQVSLQGWAPEIHYMEQTRPRFARVQTVGCVPVYDQAIEPELVAFIRSLPRSEDRVDVEIYYDNRIEYWHYDPKQAMQRLDQVHFIQDGAEPHEYENVPVAIFRNNEEMVGDIEPALDLIDAYDRLMSDSMNEIDRFSSAYLVLRNMSMSKQDAENAKWNKIFEVFGDEADVKFLTKEVPHEFIAHMGEWIRKEIHKQTHVPDFADDSVASGGLSGVAMDRMLYDFENLCSVKEMFFKDGLYRRVELLSTVMGKVGMPVGDIRDVDFVFNRHKVTSMTEQGQALQFYAGHVSERTLLEQFAPFVDDPDAEIEAVSEEKQSNLEMFGAGLMDEPDDRPDDDNSEG